MKKIELTAYDLAQRFVGCKEVPGAGANPQIMAMLQLDQKWPDNDEVSWCSAFTNYIAWLLRLPRSKSLQARSWLNVGTVIPIEEAEPGFDVVIFKRGSGEQPGPEVTDAPGHVAFFAGREGDQVLVLGGNQGNQVQIARYPREQVLGVRRLLC